MYHILTILILIAGYKLITSMGNANEELSQELIEQDTELQFQELWDRVTSVQSERDILFAEALIESFGKNNNAPQDYETLITELQTQANLIALKQFKKIA